MVTYIKGSGSNWAVGLWIETIWWQSVPISCGCLWRSVTCELWSVFYIVEWYHERIYPIELNGIFVKFLFLGDITTSCFCQTAFFVMLHIKESFFPGWKFFIFCGSSFHTSIIDGDVPHRNLFLYRSSSQGIYARTRAAFAQLHWE